jgi:hypothetical protein
MDHPEVRAWLEEAAAEPGVLDRPADPEIARHLEQCAGCAAERESLRATSVALDLAIGPSIGARQRVLDNVRELGRQRRPADRRPPATEHRRGRYVGWFGDLAARPAAALLALGLLVFAVGALAGALGGGLLADDEPQRRLDRAVAEMTRLAADPGSVQLTLRDEAGSPAGLVVHDPAAARLAVVSGALPDGAAADYWCYLERDGRRTPIGPMHVEGETHFWAGPMDGVADAGRPGDRFLVMGRDSDGPPVLVGDF